MEHLGWERNICTNLINRHQHQQQIIEETLVFDSQDLFSNPIRKPNSAAYLNPITATTSSPAKNMDSVNFDNDAPNQTYGNTDTTAIDIVTCPESLDCFLSAANYTSSDHEEAIFPYSCNNYINVNNYSTRVPKKPRLMDPGRSASSSTIDFRQGTESDETDSEAIAQMKEMIYRAAAFRPVSFADEEVVEKPKRRNVRISSDPQTVAARQRRERISERIRVLQKLVPGGNKLDTASMLDEAANYLKFLRSQVKALEQFGQQLDYVRCSTTSSAESTSQRAQNVDPGNNIVTPFPMQSHVVLLPYQQLYPTPPPCMK